MTQCSLAKEGGFLMRRTILLMASMALALLLSSGVAFSQSTYVGDLDTDSLPDDICSSSNPGPSITVMTRNLYLGADLDPVFQAVAGGNPQDIIQATTATWQNVQATNFPERAGALADEIEHSEPLLIGLQEVSLYRTGDPDSFFGNPTLADHVEYDFLKILLNELDQRGLNYRRVTVTRNTDAETPGFTAPGVLQDIRLTDRDVILVRKDPPTSELNTSNKQSENFAARVSLPVGNTGQSIELLRGWGSVDVTLGGQTFRFINTHLEQEGAFNAIQVAQGNELLGGPADTSLPVILVGDFNSRADGLGTPTYGNLIGAGFEDAWSATHPGEPGNTFGHDADLLNTTVDLTQRLDLVLFRHDVCALDADVVGDELDDRTASGLWPSDHAGVVATLRGE